MRMNTTSKIAIGVFLAFAAGVILTKCTSSDNNIKSSEIYKDGSQNGVANNGVANNDLTLQQQNNEIASNSIAPNKSEPTVNNQNAINGNHNNGNLNNHPANNNQPNNNSLNSQNNNSNSTAKKIDANTEALASQEAVPSCSASAKRKLPVKSWSHLGTITATIKGSDCNTAIVNMAIKGEDGKLLYNLSAPARDFGINNNSSSSEVSKILDKSLPNSSVRASAYPKWSEGKNAPTFTDFKREDYETTRFDDVPVVCLKIPSAPQKCVAMDKTTNLMKTFSRD